nr:hypothetical protein [Actinomycetota bacterium]
MTEAKGIVAGNHRRARPDELLAHETQQVAGHGGLVDRQSLNGASVEDLALDRPTLERLALGPRELVDPGSEERLDRGRNAHVLTSALAHHRQHLLHEERVPFSRSQDPPPKSRVEL